MQFIFIPGAQGDMTEGPEGKKPEVAEILNLLTSAQQKLEHCLVVSAGRHIGAQVELLKVIRELSWQFAVPVFDPFSFSGL